MTSLHFASLIVVLSLASVWFIAALEYSDRRHQRVMKERAEERRDRQMLLQRVQAPTEAVFQHVRDTTPEEPVVPPQRDFDPAWDMIGVDPLGVE